MGVYILFRYSIVDKTMGPLFYAFKVSYFVVEALFIAFLLGNKQTLTLCLSSHSQARGVPLGMLSLLQALPFTIKFQLHSIILISIKCSLLLSSTEVEGVRHIGKIVVHFGVRLRGLEIPCILVVYYKITSLHLSFLIGRIGITTQVLKDCYED